MQTEMSINEQILRALKKSVLKNQIKTNLIEQGYDERFVSEIVQETAKLYYNKMRAKGLAYIMTGAIICFISFLLTITSSFTHFSFPFVLYGLTSVGILIIFLGFIKIF